MNIWRQLRTILLLPGIVIVVISTIILYFTDASRPTYAAEDEHDILVTRFNDAQFQSISFGNKTGGQN
jgi:uncharacterized protein YpmB